MGDVLMIALLIGAIAVFAAYVAGCDRVVGRDDRADAADRERVA